MRVLKYRERHKWTNKEIAFRIIVPVMLMIIIVFSIVAFLALTSIPKATVVNVKEKIILSIEDDKKTRGPLFGYSAGLGWKAGALEITVDEVTVFNSIYEAGIDKDDLSFFTDETENMQLLVLQITVMNDDVVFFDEMNYAVGHLMASDAFEGWNVLRGDKYESFEPQYFSEHNTLSEETRDYWIGKLNPGETKTIKLGYFIPDADQELVLKFGANGQVQKYGVRITS